MNSICRASKKSWKPYCWLFLVIGLTVGPAKGQETVTSVGFTAASFNVNENAGVVEVCIIVLGFQKQFSGRIRTSGVTAREGYDFAASNIQVSINDNGKSCYFIPIINDENYEGNKKFKVTLTLDENSGSVGIDRNEAEVIIIDDESPCDPNAEAHEIGGEIECFCKQGYCGNGTSCQDINECWNDCACPNGQICQNWNGSYECLSSDIDECAEKTDDCNHELVTCNNTIGSFECNCIDGYSWDGLQYVDFDECANETDNCNNEVATCNNTIGSFECTCNDGYSGNGVLCDDIDECTDETDDCHNELATCNNTIGSFECTCNDGYSGNGVQCDDTDECDTEADNCHIELGTCNNTIGSFKCDCIDGYSGDGVRCDDTDECADNSETDNCHSEVATCNNTIGSFECTCNDGYSGNGVQCDDIDECDNEADNCHNEFAACNNTIGSFECNCIDGYSGDGIQCDDINECALRNDNCLDHLSTCNNTMGSFLCTCIPGYTGNGVQCENINECDEETDNCHRDASCTDTDGSHSCTCNLGYTGNGTYCHDVNECTESSNNCHANALCQNTNGSFLCTCDSDYTGNGTYCQDIKECSRNEDNCSPQAICTNQIGSFECVCKDGYKGNGTHCEDNNECTEIPPKCAGKGQRCTNHPGTYRCSCISPRQQFNEDESACIDVQASYQGGFVIINREYKEAYNDTNSLEYYEFTQELTNELEDHYRQTSIVSAYFVGVIIIRLHSGSVGVDYVAAFNATNGINNQRLRQELGNTLNVTQNGTFIGDYQLSESTDPDRVAEVLSFKDYDECNPAGTVHIPDCDNNATCVNRNASYDCVCDEGFVKNDTRCIIIPIVREVDKDKVDEVRYVVIAIIAWLGFCFLVDIIVVVVAVVIFAKIKTVKYPVIQGTKGNIRPRVITEPSYTAYPSIHYCYDDKYF